MSPEIRKGFQDYQLGNVDERINYDPIRSDV